MKRMQEVNDITFTQEELQNGFPYFTKNLTNDKVNAIVNLSKCTYDSGNGRTTMHCVGKYEGISVKSVSFAYFEMTDGVFDTTTSIHIVYNYDDVNNTWIGNVNFSEV